MDIGLIGFGAIGRGIFSHVDGERPWRVTTVVASKRSHQRISEEIGEQVAVVTSIDELGQKLPDLFVECAGHAAVSMHGLPALTLGRPLMIISVGALTDQDLWRDLKHAAAASGARIILPSGALAGIDGLAAARQAGLEKVTLISSKPPQAWRSTPAEQKLDLDSLTEPVIHFSGTAREAASLYPKNANAAAMVAIAGIGFKRTRVELVADPTLNGNCHRIVAEGAFGRMEMRLENRAMPDNPKTSMMTMLSILRALDNETTNVPI